MVLSRCLNRSLPFCFRQRLTLEVYAVQFDVSVETLSGLTRGETRSALPEFIKVQLCGYTWYDKLTCSCSAVATGDLSVVHRVLLVRCEPSGDVHLQILTCDETLKGPLQAETAGLE